MYKYKRVILGLVATGVFLLVPVSVSAQTANDIQLAMLRELVAQLQERLDYLIAQSVAQAAVSEERRVLEDSVFFDDDSFLNRINADIVARYRVDDMQINARSNRHREYFDRVETLVPDDYHQYFAEFVIFETGRDSIGAYVETAIPYQGQWRYAVNEDELRHPLNSALTTELIVHEFGHIFSLHEVFTSSQPGTCHEFFERSGCVSPDVMYGKFLTEFWNDELLDRAVEIRESADQTDATEDFYEEYEDDFVSQYAASSPAEDFAESFAHFVLFDDDSYRRDASQKVNFFNRFSKTREIKAEILDEI